MAQEGTNLLDESPLPPLPSMSGSMFNPAFAVTSSANPALPQKLGNSYATPKKESGSRTGSAETSPTTEESVPMKRHVADPSSHQRLAAAAPPTFAAPPPPAPPGGIHNAPPPPPTDNERVPPPLSATQAPQVARPVSTTRVQQTIIEPKTKPQEDNWWDNFSKEMFSGLDCCAPPDRNKKSDRRQAMCGVGLALKEVGYGELMVDSLVPGSSAHASGLILPGDEITEIDDTYVYRKRKDVVAGLLMGAEGSRVAVSVKR
eukprot:CAMPEP_0181319872 /NCGR_PEP_ID=MMETSP1101-20121128/17809_1 /TAXON_ID=46948 /ORGANISM="Rhodomonas abbreviata, Strain Caron Lab Isolate" /LENGTH=259 /DNA_ID=CAMNT_0023427513 /DNA_START=244 /DNA_END=1020 /DNA_ORIENTATION=+